MDPATDMSARNPQPPSSISASNAQADQSQQSSHSQSEPRSQGRDLDKDPILVPRSAKVKTSSRSPTSSTYQRSFDQLQHGLDTLESNDSDADSDADQALAAQQRAESMARWTARRSSLSQSISYGRSSSVKLEAPLRSATRSLASNESLPVPTPESKAADEHVSPLLSSPLKATPGRKSIAAVFESMQKEREARAAEEHRQWQEKQARRDRERAARAFGMPSRRRTSASSSQLDSPASAYTAPDTPLSHTSTTVYQSMVSRATPSRSPVSSVVSASPLLSSPGSPKVDEGAAVDVQPRHLGEEAAARIPETLAEDDEQDLANDKIEPPSDPGVAAEGVESSQAAALPTTPQTKHASGFGFAPQPMALELSPARSASDFSSPASSPRKNAHRRQNTNTVSVARLPPASLGAARERLNQVLRQGPAESTPAEPQHEQARETPRTPYNPQTPISGILSSAKKGLPQFSAARRGHSVRFSPRPDYRSDSGSWDESGTQSIAGLNDDDNDDSREAAVSRLLLPAQQITIPDVLADASSPAQATTAAEDGKEDQPVKEPVAEAESPVKVERKEMTSQPHTPSRAAALAASRDDSVAASFSQSVRFPGAYAPTPVKYSRHVIRPSPQTTRILPLDNAQASSAPFTSRSGAEQYGLFPTSVDSAGMEIPRESTPPPSQSSPHGWLPPNDPRNSPRSPRPVDLGREGFARFHAGSSSSSSSDDSGAAIETKANTQANEMTDDSGVQGTIRKILQTVDEAHAGRVRRLELGKQLGAARDRVAGVGASPPPASSARPRKPALDGMAQLQRNEEQDRLRAEQLRSQVMHALATLADRIVELESSGGTASGGDLVSASSPPSALASIRGKHRRGLPRWAVVLLVVGQCALMAWLMALAERKAARLRMYAPPLELRELYHNHNPHHRVEWNTIASDPYLTPLLQIPGLHTLTRTLPPLPAPAMLSLHAEHPIPSLLDLYTTYVRLNGLPVFLLQLAIYAVSQLLGCAILLVMAPVQIVWTLVQPTSF